MRLTENSTKQLIDLVDPDKDYQKIIGAKGKKKSTSRRIKPNGRPGEKKTMRHGPSKTLLNS